MMFPMMFFGWIVWLLLAVAAVIGLTRLPIRPGQKSTSSTGQPRTGESPEEILQARYARGEITREQYELMKQDIG